MIENWSADHQQQAAEVARAYFGNVLGPDVDHVNVESKLLTKRIAVALADAERRGKEQHDALRARVEALAERQYREAWAAWEATLPTVAGVPASTESRIAWARVNQALSDQEALRAALDQNGGQEQ